MSSDCIANQHDRHALRDLCLRLHTVYATSVKSPLRWPSTRSTSSTSLAPIHQSVPHTYYNTLFRRLNHNVRRKSTKSALSFHGTTKSTGPELMFHALFATNNARPSRRHGRFYRLSTRLGGPRGEARIALQSVRLIDERTRPACPRGPSRRRLGRAIDGGRPWLGQDVDARRSSARS